jgi:hypothetical protein
MMARVPDGSANQDRTKEGVDDEAAGTIGRVPVWVWRRIEALIGAALDARDEVELTSEERR